MWKALTFSGLIAAAAVLAGCLENGRSAAAADTPAAATRPAQGVAVVELFTSEGCSSCPPADAALADLIRDSAGKPVYALALHVDYWDGGGWRDPFSNAAATARQQAYARAFGRDDVYTPQAVVNGRREFVGSNRAALAAAVADALARPVAGTLSATAAKAGDGVRVGVTSAGLPAGTAVRFALVQPHATTEVRGGENGGRRLSHDNVVRASASAALDAAGRASATLPSAGLGDVGGWSVVLFAQQPSDGQVVAATRVPLPR